MYHKESISTPIAFIVENNELTLLIQSNNLEVISDKLDELGKAEADICIIPVIKLVRMSDEEITEETLKKEAIEKHNNELFEKNKNKDKE